MNLINRLAKEHPDKTILELSVSECPDMARVNLRNLYWVLKNLGEVNVIRVDDQIKKSAKHALDRMLAIK
jgi:quinolinate synthase